MNNWIRFGIAAVVSVILAVTANGLPYTPLLYFLAPGFWLGDSIPVHAVNALGGYLFPVYASAVIWTLVIFGIWWAIVRSPR